MILLTPEKYHLLSEKVKQVEFNHLFARAVIEHHVKGKVWVDDISDPQTAYLVHPYGMSLLMGDHQNDDFNRQFKNYALNTEKVRDHFEWMQAWPETWNSELKILFGSTMLKAAENIHQTENGIIEINTRVNFSFNINKYAHLKREPLSDEEQLVETSAEYFTKMPGSVIPLKFWDSPDDFMRRGKGYTLLHRGEIASTAYSAFVIDDKLELGIETTEPFRGRGYARQTCCRLIDYCIDHHLEPIWACRLENTASYNLALHLGFEPVRMIPFYRLSN
jgi:RimJ/RimL family protein N-acetyltransferase